MAKTYLKFIDNSMISYAVRFYFIKIFGVRKSKGFLRVENESSIRKFDDIFSILNAK